MSKAEQNGRAYDKRRAALYATDTAKLPPRTKRRRETMDVDPPDQTCQLEPRDWIDTPEDRAEVAAIISKKR